MCKECGCQSGQECGCGEHSGGGGGSCGCGDHGPHPHMRRYQTKAEQAAELEAYLGDLKNELKAVEERLADLRK